MKKHINIALTMLAFVGMMVFASQAAIAASSNSFDKTPDNATATSAKQAINDSSIDANNQSEADDAVDVEDRQDVSDAVSNAAEQASEAEDIGDNIDTPDDNVELPADDLGVDK